MWLSILVCCAWHLGSSSNEDEVLDEVLDLMFVVVCYWIPIVRRWIVLVGLRLAFSWCGVTTEAWREPPFTRVALLPEKWCFFWHGRGCGLTGSIWRAHSQSIGISCLGTEIVLLWWLSIATKPVWFTLHRVWFSVSRGLIVLFCFGYGCLP